VTSPFLDRDPADWVASNELAFAIRDAFPVSEGHTLIVTRRPVPTWFEATPEEQAAVMELVEAVKRELDEQLAPDGYNVGFNAGEAAGQTVMHLHVHVIPRYRGDMDDPRGGVRHVIPAKGNYQRPHHPLATGGEGDPLLARVEPLFELATDVAIVAAFVQQSGLARLRGSIDSALARGARLRILTGDYLNITQAAALEDLLDWMSSTSGDAELTDSDDPITEGMAARGNLQARVIEVATLEGRTRAFHPKSWRFEGPGQAVLYVGSSNISRSALETGIEWNLRVDRDRDAVAYAAAVEAFDTLWSRARPLDTDWLATYAERARVAAVALPPGEEEAEPLAPPPDPHEVQDAALASLAETRAMGHRRGLVVLATGLGKTWLAAFDVAAFADELGRPPRVLFLAHRAEILRQAAQTFRTMLRPRWPGTRVTWFAGQDGSLDGDLVFASVQKLARRVHLDRLDPHAFEYVVVDEVHHATADSYRRILDRLEPLFVLGLTATPDRADEADVLGLLDDNLVHRADLGLGIEIGMLVPFDYFGLKDDVDYSPTSIPWRNRRFDPVELARAVQTERRMEQMWEAWQAHPGQRTLVFCASIAHAVYVRDWLLERGVSAAAVHSEDSSDPRDASLGALADGGLAALCSVDVFNEGVDLPDVDRVVMLRPTESPVVFMQQLGRGLRRPRDGGKDRLTIIDFVGNHRIFLDRVRRLLSLASRDGAALVAQLLDAPGPLELPHGCSVDVELEAKDVLRRLLPRGGSEVERMYRELHASRGERPTAGELQRMGYLPSTLRLSGAHASWFEFVRSEGHLDPEELHVLDGARAWLAELETTAMSKCFKMVVLEALIEADALGSGLPLGELARRSHAILARSPELFRDVDDDELAELQPANESKWLAYWKKNPIKAWTERTKKKTRLWFRVDGDRFVPELPIPAGARATFVVMTRELVDYRLAQYRSRNRGGEPGRSFDCKVTWNQRDPILKLPSRGDCADVPSGETDVRLPDGRVWTFGFAKEFVNVARPVGTPRNQLPDLLRGWYGPNAGHPGTDFHVRFESTPDGWWLSKLGQVIELRARGRLRSYPDLRAAAGAAEGAHEGLEASEVLLPVELEGDELFAVRAAGSSMDGGTKPIRDGDWLVMQFCRGDALPAVEGRVALVQLPGERFGSRYQVKRIVRGDDGWLLRSDNPGAPSYPADDETIPIARLKEIVPPERLAPAVGGFLADEELQDAFGLSAPPRTGRIDGHLFLLIEEAGALVAPDRLTHPIERRPGETAFVLARGQASEPWRYCGVGRWVPDEELWSIPDLDFAIWRALGDGRSASRRLPEEAVARAAELVERLLAAHPVESWLEHGGRRCRIAGVADRGGLRIDGGPEGFAERTVSLVDIAWVLAARDDVDSEGGVLDEARVNKLRYLEGTPKGSTRWIDTGWALLVVWVAGEGHP